MLGENALKESESDEQVVEVLTCTHQFDDYSGTESGDSESDEDVADIDAVSIWLCQQQQQQKNCVRLKVLA